ncbi:enoyl-CoA hydratase/isomerase family protein [Salipiger sp. P9]|uniref:enoyl-CoA hydratase/isomerase family protein n=1 Tax=Salipiger pentaromativorans TaxID=2943193 RepID=UPI002157417E|nr:enoyl-CoA hydratase/isomerase family protein [Salipiger pentaromativorans]MCR8551024.1 enoyl-CoA hydratase/isomerase family protein [Salipiger pentaromativorans]
MTINVSTADHVRVIELDDPAALNALTPEGLTALREALRAAQDDDAVRVIILTGAGDRAFCTGANLKKTFPPKSGFARNALLGREAEAREGGYTRLLDLSDLQIWKPLIAAVNGYCLGGGLELALQCDLRIASASASFALPEVRVASIPAVGGVQALLRAIPAAHAMKLALTGDRIDAETALAIGLVSDVTTPEALLPEARAIAARIAGNGPLAVQMVKKLSLETAHLAPAAFIAQSNTAWGLLRDSADRIEGRAAFGEKRKPNYTGN